MKEDFAWKVESGAKSPPTPRRRRVSRLILEDLAQGTASNLRLKRARELVGTFAVAPYIIEAIQLQQ
jgi:hypothetical protein